MVSFLFHRFIISFFLIELIVWFIQAQNNNKKEVTSSSRDCSSYFKLAIQVVGHGYNK